MIANCFDDYCSHLSIIYRTFSPNYLSIQLPIYMRVHTAVYIINNRSKIKLPRGVEHLKRVPALRYHWKITLIVQRLLFRQCKILLRR